MFEVLEETRQHLIKQVYNSINLLLFIIHRLFTINVKSHPIYRLYIN